MANFNSFLRKEIELTRGGFASNAMSIANDLNFHSREALGSTAADPRYIDTWGGRVLLKSGDSANGVKNYIAPTLQNGKTAWISTSIMASGEDRVEAALGAWKHYADEISQSPQGKGFINNFLWHKSVRNKLLQSESMAGVNKQLYVKFGGVGNLVAPGFIAWSGYNGFKDGSRDGGIAGGLTGAAGGIVSGWLQGKAFGLALANPAVALGAAVGIATIGYSTYKMFDVKNQGNQYLQQGRMGGLSWNSGPTPGMNSIMNNTIRARGMQAIEASRFNSMKSLGNESYMYSSPLARYSNPGALNRLTPLSTY